MRWLIRLLAWLLGLALVATAGLWVLGQTIGSSVYLDAKARQAHVADAVAAGLPGLLAASTETPSDTKVILQEAITPVFVQDQLDAVLPQLEQYYQTNGIAPKLDLSSLQDRITAAGYEVPEELAPTLQRPIPVTAGRLDGPLKATVQTLQQWGWVAPVAAVVLIGVILTLARTRRWIVLAGAAFSAALETALLAGTAHLLPSFVFSTLDTSAAKPLAVPVRDYLAAIASDQTRWLLMIAAGLAGATLVCLAIHGLLHVRHRFGRKTEPPVPPAPTRPISTLN